MPIGLAWDHAFSGPQCIVRGLDTTQGTICLDSLDGLDEQAARLNDGLVGRPEVLFGAIHNVPHAFLHGAVLRVDALDTRKIDRFLHLPIDEVVVFPALLRTEGGLIDIQRTVAQTEFKTVFLIQRLVCEAVLPVVHHGVVVIHGYPDVAGHRGVAPVRRGGTELMERHNEVIGPDEGYFAGPGVNTSVAVAIVRHVNFYCRCTTSRPAAGGTNSSSKRAVEDLGMGGINASFQGLEPVALLNDLGHVAMGFGHLRPGEIGQRRLQCRWSHVGPDNAADFHRWVGRGTNLILEMQFARLIHHVDTAALNVELPAVVDTAQATLFIAAKKQRYPPMRTVLLEKPDTTGRVTKGYQVFAQQLDAHRWAIGFRHLPREQRRHPVPAHGLSHRHARTNTRDQFVFFVR